MTIKIHPIQTGTVQIKDTQVDGSFSTLPSPLNLLFAGEWADWFPIYAWVIEHLDGLFVVDTGETARTAEAGYFPRWQPYYRKAVRFNVQPEDEIGPQMAKIGFDTDDVTAVILTHLHTDHAGGLNHFPNSDIWAHPDEFKAGQGFAGKVAGYLPHRWPEWFAPKSVKFQPEAIGSFDSSFPITQDGTIRVVPTPGHTEAHQSVIVQLDGISYFLAGDTSYNQAMMVAGKGDGVGTAVSATTLQTIQQFVQETPTVYLPSHDPESARRLQEREVVRAERVMALVD